MGALKHYVLDLITTCVPDERFGQDTVEFAIQMGLVKLTYDKTEDVGIVMSRYSELVEAYQKHVQHNEAVLLESYGPLFTAIERRAA